MGKSLLVIVLCWFGTVRPSFGVPRELVIIPKLTGIVKSAAWRSDFAFTRLDLEWPPGPSESIETKKAHWVVVLTNVQGVNEAKIRSISRAFSFTEPLDAGVYASYKSNKGEMLIEIGGGKGIDIKLGSRVILEDVKFQETDRNAAAGPVVYKRIIVESVDA